MMGEQWPVKEAIPETSFTLNPKSDNVGDIKKAKTRLDTPSKENQNDLNQNKQTNAYCQEEAKLKYYHSHKNSGQN